MHYFVFIYKKAKKLTKKSKPNSQKLKKKESESKKAQQINKESKKLTGCACGVEMGSVGFEAVSCNTSPFVAGVGDRGVFGEWEKRGWSWG